MPLRGDELPQLRTRVPGPASESLVDVLARRECPAITARRARRAAQLGQATDDPIVWEEAAGAVIRDADGNTFVDLTSGFGVAFVGHRHPEVVRAVRAQQDRLLHAMGDAYPDVARIRLLDRLAGLCPPGLEAMILGLSGADAVDAAVKTAVVATGRPGVISFEASYHGLSLGTVPLQGYMPSFAHPFREILRLDVRFLPWGCAVEALDEALADGRVGLVLAEPIQGRGGMREPPPGWLAMVAERARAAGALLALDEIQTGLGRTGDWFAGPTEGVVPDILCLGKHLGGGFPLSATVGTREVMDAWGASTGQAIHTQTFLGHPVGCAAALAVLELTEREDLPGRARQVGGQLTEAMTRLGLPVQGRGLMLGVRVPRSLAVSRALLQRGYLVLPAGQQAEVLALTPPACLTEEQSQGFSQALEQVLEEVPS